MKLYTNLRKYFVKEDYSKGVISEIVRNKALNMLSKRIAKGQKVLYVGCGEGLFMLPNALKFKDVFHTGIDDWDQALVLVKGKVYKEGLHNVEVEKATAESIPFENGRFEHVFFLNTLLNQTDNESVMKILEELLRVCSVGGRIYFDIRNKTNILFKIIYKISLCLDSTKPHAKMYSKKEISDLLATIGITNVNFVPGSIFKTVYMVEVIK